MANIARRLTLNLPICLDEKDHRDRGDGYCNCGEKIAVDPERVRRVKHATDRLVVPRPRYNLDQIEGNLEEYK